MKHNVILIALLIGLAFFGCKKHEVETLTPKITDDKVETTASSATFTWTVDWPGKLISVVEVSENEDMSHSQIYGSEEETENHNFTVTVTDLKAATKYYYRYLVWNKFYVDNKYVFENNCLSTYNSLPTGAIKGVFSVSDSKHVWFSQGNLQYQASTNTWRFAENQWDFIGGRDNGGAYYGNVSGSLNNDISETNSGWIDLFGWGTSGWNSGASCFQPWSTEEVSHYYSPGGITTNDLTGAFANADWGINNKISNGENKSGLWRTLTNDEWSFILETRNASTIDGYNNARFVKAIVNDIRGVILFPDEYKHPNGVKPPVSINENENTGWDNNKYNYIEWHLIGSAGAVFLPAAGLRNGNRIYNASDNVYVWSSTHYDRDHAYNLYFGNSGVHPLCYCHRQYGISVRLVCDVE